MLVPDRKRGSCSSLIICLSWTQYDDIPRGTKCLQEYVYFRESPFILANRRFLHFAENIFFPIVKDCVFVFSAQLI